MKDYIFAGLALIVLLAFVWLFGRDLWSTFTGAKRATPAEELDDPVLYIATAVAGLVGAVTAAFLGVEAKSGFAGSSDWPERIRTSYVIVYVLFGAAASIAWVKKKGETPVSLRNLAVTFIGIAIAAVGTYLGVEAGLL
jgi:hypothetical protein